MERTGGRTHERAVPRRFLRAGRGQGAQTPPPRPAPPPPLSSSATKSLTDADHFGMIRTAQRRFAPTVIGITRNSDRHQIGMSDRHRRNTHTTGTVRRRHTRSENVADGRTDFPTSAVGRNSLRAWPQSHVSRLEPVYVRCRPELAPSMAAIARKPAQDGLTAAVGPPASPATAAMFTACAARFELHWSHPLPRLQSALFQAIISDKRSSGLDEQRRIHYELAFSQKFSGVTRRQAEPNCSWAERHAWHIPIQRQRWARRRLPQYHHTRYGNMGPAAHRRFFVAGARYSTTHRRP